MFRLVRRIVGVVVSILAVYLVVTFVQVWLASRRDEARTAQAILVLGAAQYNGRPSAVLRARLDHAADLFHRNLSPVIVVTGGKQPGDRFTEASASADYLAAKGIPDAAVLRETEGHNSWQSLASSAAFLKREGRTSVLLVSDPFHSARIAAMATELGLVAHVSPTRTSPISGFSSLQHMAKETLEVAAGRIVGFRRLVGFDERVTRVRKKVSTG
ncbi:MAG: hypothetical protein QOG64_2734 [Acidimicrobiaceae bacterium]|nr:hypothetical protein [Acidimicrobiaceae bacterium]